MRCVEAAALLLGQQRVHARIRRGLSRLLLRVSENFGVPYFGVLRIRVLLFKVLY